MTQPPAEDPTAVDAEPSARPAPLTGHPGIDGALAGLELSEDVHQHPEQIATALDAITYALNPTAQPPLPAQ